MILSDGDKIYIPKYEETAQSQASAHMGASFITNSASTAGKININSASLEELQTLSGIGPVTAQKIIDYRSANGKFLELNHLMDVPGIGEKTFDALEDSICI
ncbi:MAG: helix-hairpin-helix domain-containing protein [Clostridia bacterium]|nr:helix-hairpin-helix domain-containing protein [Clostridia bacterium]